MWAGRWRRNEVAVKQMVHGHLSADEVADFYAEMQLLSELRQDNIVREPPTRTATPTRPPNAKVQRLPEPPVVVRSLGRMRRAPHRRAYIPPRTAARMH